ncbi:MAG: efflux RND transporter periplasmic adaptor subunit [Christensenellales bacterium]
MKKKKKWIKWVVILVIVAAVIGWFMMVSRKTQDVAYTDVQATLGSIETYYNFDGLVKAKRVQTITAAQSDKVRTVYVTQNQQVKKGERLYRLEGGETVEADIAGEVTGLYVEQGGVVTAGETTVQIIDMNSLEIELNVDEYDVAAVVPGQAVQVNVLAPDVSFAGSVMALNKNARPPAICRITRRRSRLTRRKNVYPGMQVSAKVLKEQAEDAVLIRQDAVQFDDYNKPYVLVRGADGKSVEQKSVTVGVSDGMNCEITSGLNAGDTVLKSSGVTMAELMEQMQAQQRTGR